MMTPELRAIDTLIRMAQRREAPELIIRDHIAAAIAEAVPRWIPVSEGMPMYQPDGDNTYPVVYPSFIDGRPALFTASISPDGEWIDEHGLNMFWHGRITHWMALALPKAEDTTP